MDLEEEEGDGRWSWDRKGVVDGAGTGRGW